MVELWEVIYTTQGEFDVNILNWSKAITVPYKVANYLNKKYIFIINNKKIDVAEFLNWILFQLRFVHVFKEKSAKIFVWRISELGKYFF